MSQENVEQAHRIAAAINRHDIDGVLALTDPDAEFIPRIVEVDVVRDDAFEIVLRAAVVILAAPQGVVNEGRHPVTGNVIIRGPNGQWIDKKTGQPVQ